MGINWKFRNSTDGMLLRIVNGLRALCTQTYDEGGLDLPNEDML